LDGVVQVLERALGDLLLSGAAFGSPIFPSTLPGVFLPSV
jgi:hypothetical protein